MCLIINMQEGENKCKGNTLLLVLQVLPSPLYIMPWEHMNERQP